MTTKLRAVTTADVTRPRVFVVWTDPWNFQVFDQVCSGLAELNFRVVNYLDELRTDEIDLRHHLRIMADATHISLPDTWWTSAAAHQLVQVAGWLGIKFLNHAGDVLPTASLKGSSA